MGTMQDMVRQMIKGASAKLASDASYDESDEGQEVRTPSAQVSDSDLTNPEYIEKLASSVSYIAEHLSEIQPEASGPLGRAIAKLANGGELKVTKSIAAKQVIKKDKPAGLDAATESTNSALVDGGELKTNENKRPGGTERQKIAHSKAAAKLKAHLLAKMAGEDVIKANISGKKGDGALRTFKAEDAAPTPAGGGNSARRHIQSNAGAINMKPRDAVAPQKEQMKAVLDEPMMSAKHDSVLHNNLRNADKAGVKIAAVGKLFRKVAEQGSQRQKGLLGQMAKVASARKRESDDVAMKLLTDALEQAKSAPARV